MIGDQRDLVTELTDARALLARLSAADLGKLASSILPASTVGEVGPWSHVLMLLIRAELCMREADG